MVDVSRSMSPYELEIQRRGYAEALQSDAVYAAVRSGPLQRVALSYVEWAGQGTQRMVVDWRVVQSRTDLAEFARVLSASFTAELRRTSISGALDFGVDTLERNIFDGLRRVIDVSGDGPNNSGRPVLDARAAAVERGITINGLPLKTREGLGGQWHLDDLDAYYRACVIGGPGAFVILVLDWADFAEAVRRKLVLEMVSLPPEDWLPIQYGGAPVYDCLIGEKIWERNRRYYDMP